MADPSIDMSVRPAAPVVVEREKKRSCFVCFASPFRALLCVLVAANVAVTTGLCVRWALRRDEEPPAIDDPDSPVSPTDPEDELIPLEVPMIRAEATIAGVSQSNFESNYLIEFAFVTAVAESVSVPTDNVNVTDVEDIPGGIDVFFTIEFPDLAEATLDNATMAALATTASSQLENVTRVFVAELEVLGSNATGLNTSEIAVVVERITPVVVVILVEPSPSPSATPSATATPSTTPLTPPSTSASPSRTPSPTPSTTAPATPSSSPTSSNSATPTPSVSGSPSTTPTATPSVTTTPSPSTTTSASATPSTTLTATPSASTTPSTTPSATSSSSATPTPSTTPTPSNTPSSSTTPTPSNTPSSSSTPSTSSTSSATPTPSTTGTPTPSTSSTPSVTPSSSVTPTASVTSSSSGTPTPSTTSTPSATPSSSNSPSATPSSSITPSATPSSSNSPSATPTPSITPSATPSSSATGSPTPSSSVTPTPSITATPTSSPSSTPSTTPSATPTPSVSPTSSVTPSATSTPTPSVTPTSSTSPSTSPSATPTPSTSSSVTPSPSTSSSMTPTPSTSPSATPSGTPSSSATPSSSSTPSSTPSATPSSSPPPPPLFAGIDAAGLNGVTNVNGIVRFDTTQNTWIKYASGVDGFVNAIITWNGDIVVAGSLWNHNNVARWDSASSQWVAVVASSSSISGYVSALAVYNGDLIIAGFIPSPVTHVGRISGGTLSAMGSQFTSDVLALLSATVNGQAELYAGSGTSGFQVARWDATSSAWVGLGSLNAPTSSLTIFNGALVAGGFFTVTDSQSNTGRGVARWDGSEWVPMATGMTSSTSRVAVVTIAGSDLLIGGTFAFTAGDGSTATNVARWDGTAWHSIGSNSPGTVRSLFSWQNNIYAGLSTALPFQYAAVWTGSGSSWTQAFGTGPGGSVAAMMADGSSIVMAGGFRGVGGQPINYFGFWDGDSWEPKGAGFDSTVRAAVQWSDPTYGGLVVAGSFFRTGDGVSVRRVARWDGAAWRAVGSSGGIDGMIQTLTVWNGKLVVAGNLMSVNTGVQGQPSSNVGNLAVFDPANPLWTGLGAADTFSSTIRTVQVFQGNLYAGGFFSAPFRGVTMWNANTPAWERLGSSGIQSGSVTGMAEFNQRLWVVGSFSTVEGQSAMSIASWSGSSWTIPRPTQMSWWNIEVCTVWQGMLYVGGNLGSWDSLIVSGVAAIDAMGSVSNVGGGVAGSVTIMGALDSGLFVGGSFSTAGSSNVPSRNAAMWDGSTWASLAGGFAETPSVFLGTPQNTMPTPSPTPSATPSPTPSPSTTPSTSPSTSSTPSTSPSPSITPSTSPTPSITPSASATPSSSPPPLPLIMGFNERRIPRLGSTNGVAFVSGTTGEWEKLANGVTREGYNEVVYAATEFQGQVVVGGSFSLPSGLGNLAIWDSGAQTWSAVGGGVGSEVYALVEFGGRLVVGGSFQFVNQAGPASYFSRIAAWDPSSSSWSAMGSSMQQSVNALLVFNGELYAGGETNGFKVAKWDATGSTWVDVGTSSSFAWGSVRALVAFNGQLVAGGDFEFSSGGTNHYRLATYSSQNGWEPMGPFTMMHTVFALHVWSGALVVAGDFSLTVSNGDTGSYVVKWTGSAWEKMGSEINGLVYTLQSLGGDLHAGGTFSKYIAKWTGSAWTTAPESGTSGNVRAMAVVQGGMVVVGQFENVGGPVANYIASYDNGVWSPLAQGFSGIPKAALRWTQNPNYAGIIVGGDFWYLGATGTVPANFIQSWDGTQWRAVADGFNGAVHALVVWNGALVAAGRFSGTGAGNSVTNVGILDASQTLWSQLGQSNEFGWGSTVNALAVFQGQLYAGGDFSSPRSYLTRRSSAAPWHSWTSVGNNGINGEVNAMAEYNGFLYVGGTLSQVDNLATKALAKWDGSVWTPLNTLTSDYTVVTGLTVWDGLLVVTGQLPRWDGQVMNHLVLLDGVDAPQTLGNGFNSGTSSAASWRGDLYVTGGFTTASSGTVKVNYLARWTGSAWTQVGAGLLGAGSLAMGESASSVARPTVSPSTTPSTSPSPSITPSPSMSPSATPSPSFVPAPTSTPLWVGFSQSARTYKKSNLNGVVALSSAGEWSQPFPSAPPVGMLKTTVEWAGLSVFGSSNSPYLTAWNAATSQWTTPGGGVNDEVNALAVFNGELIVAGRFSRVNPSGGNFLAGPVAKWDGSVWTGMGTALSNVNVKTLLVWNGQLYAGGETWSASRYVVVWDPNTSEWVDVGPGQLSGNRQVFRLMEWNNQLLAVGAFTAPNAQSNPSYGMATWDGTNWVAVGPGFNNGDQGLAAAVFNGDLVVVGSLSFTDSQGVGVQGAARWTGSAWVAMGSELRYGAANAVAVFGSSLYAGGSFLVGNDGSRFARWSGSEWIVPDGMIVSEPVNALVGRSATEMWLVGEVDRVGQLSLGVVGAWDGSKFKARDGFIGSEVLVVLEWADPTFGGIVAGGVMNSRKHVVRWDGSTWNTLAFGFDNSVRTLAVWGTKLVAGGGFSNTFDSNSMQVGAQKVAVLDPTVGQWSQLADGQNIDTEVFALAVFQSRVYAAGDMTSPAASIIRLNQAETAWEAVGDAAFDGPIFTMTEYNTKLYVGGYFSECKSGMTAKGVAHWDGTAWTGMNALSQGIRNDVEVLSVWRGHLIIGGRFSDWNGQSVSNVILIDGTGVVSSLNGGVDNTVRAVGVQEGRLVIAGDFVNVNGIANSGPSSSAKRIAWWNEWPGEWEQLGGGVDATVVALRGEAQEPMPSATPSVSPTPSQTPTPLGTPSSSVTPSVTPSPSITPSGTPTPSVTPSASPRPSPLLVGHAGNAAGPTFGTNNIARLDTTSATWGAFGPGINGAAFTSLEWNNELYVGGFMTNHVLKWNPSTSLWETVGGGLAKTGSNSPHPGGVYALAVFNNELVAGGVFDVADPSGAQTPVYSVVRLVNNAWTSIGSLTAKVSSLYVLNGELYAGLHSAWQQYAVKWNPTANSNAGAWEETGGNAKLNHDVFVLSEWNGELIAGGVFDVPNTVDANGLPIQGFARLDGATGEWKQLGSDLGRTTNIYEITVWNGALVIAGETIEFTDGNGDKGRNIAMLVGSNWVSMSLDLEAYSVQGLAAHNGVLYAGGQHGDPYHLFKWNPATKHWETAFGGTDGIVTHLRSSSVHGLIVSGGLTLAGGTVTRGLGTWDGVQWSRPGDTSFMSQTYAFGTYADPVKGGTVIGGTLAVFLSPNEAATRVVVWDGSVFKLLNRGVDGTVRAVVQYGANLVVGGPVSEADWNDSPFNNIGMYNPTQNLWGPVGASGAIDAEVVALAVFGNDLFAGGPFTTPANGLARWDGSSWSTVGAGLSGTVSTFTNFNGKLYIGGSFTSVGGSPCLGLASWDGQVLACLHTSNGGSAVVVSALHVWSGTLVVGGSFSDWNGSPAPNLVQLSTAEVVTVPSSGPSGPIQAFTTRLGNLVVGGSFSTAGGNVARNLAEWDGTVWAEIGGGVEGEVTALFR